MKGRTRRPYGRHAGLEGSPSTRGLSMEWARAHPCPDAARCGVRRDRRPGAPTVLLPCKPACALASSILASAALDVPQRWRRCPLAATGGLKVRSGLCCLFGERMPCLFGAPNLTSAALNAPQLRSPWRRCPSAATGGLTVRSGLCCLVGAPNAAPHRRAQAGRAGRLRQRLARAAHAASTGGRLGIRPTLSPNPASCLKAPRLACGTFFIRLA